MGYVMGVGKCFNCSGLMSFNPNLVPSIRDPKTGNREPVCKTCIERANPIREQNGLEPISIRQGAYEACNENEV